MLLIEFFIRICSLQSDHYNNYDDQPSVTESETTRLFIESQYDEKGFWKLVNCLGGLDCKIALHEESIEFGERLKTKLHYLLHL
jgi:hypothetical protein